MYSEDDAMDGPTMIDPTDDPVDVDMYYYRSLKRGTADASAIRLGAPEISCHCGCGDTFPVADWLVHGGLEKQAGNWGRIVRVSTAEGRKIRFRTWLRAHGKDLHSMQPR